jgi:transcriptional regulator with XRE-family HTH domain
MSNTVQSLIIQVIAAAKAQGLSQAQLAEKAGMTAVGLSKAKSRGDIRTSSLEALAACLDLELALVPRQSREKAAEAIKAGAFFALAGEDTSGENISGETADTPDTGGTGDVSGDEA